MWEAEGDCGFKGEKRWFRGGGGTVVITQKLVILQFCDFLRN